MSRQTLFALLATAFLLTIVAGHPATAQTPSTPSALLQRMPNTNRALLQSPFVSLYATASASKDLVETVAWAILRRNTATRLTISVALPGRRAMDFHPLRNPTIRRRMHDALREINGGAMATHQAH